jgi:polyhydroxyalkanoate synthesis regulator phasin
MAEQQSRAGDGRGVPDGLRTAIERTFAATAEGAAETRDRAEAALDEAVRRGRGAGGAASRVIEAIEGMRLASRDDVRELGSRLEELGKQVDRLETRVRTLETQPKAEG